MVSISAGAAGACGSGFDSGAGASVGVLGAVSATGAGTVFSSLLASFAAAASFFLSGRVR